MIPHGLENLQSLISLDLGGNNLQHLGDTIQALAQDSDTLPNLRYLGLDGNQLTTLPELWSNALKNGPSVTLTDVSEEHPVGNSRWGSGGLLVRLGNMGLIPANTTVKVVSSRPGVTKVVVSTEDACEPGCSDADWVPGAIYDLIDDGLCQTECNTASCRWDGGDCA